MGYFSFPHTRTYDSDLGWLINHLKGIDEKLDKYLETSVITFADPIQWDITQQYTALTMVIDADGTAYLSRQPVPAGIDISNTDYWMPVFNYNDNINQLRRNIATVSSAAGVITESLETGRLVWFNGDIYVTTTDLPAGAQIIPGSNVNQVTVEEYILSFINGIDADISDMKDDITDLQGDMTTAQGDITNLQGDMTTAQGDITNLQGDMTTAQGDILNLQGDISTITEITKKIGHYIVFCTTNPINNPSGNCSFITDGSHAFMFDLGRYDNYADIRDTLKAYGIDTIDGVYISHYHRDHDGFPTSGTYNHWKADFNMNNTIFYIPLDPPAIVGNDWSSNTRATLETSFPNNQFITPPTSSHIEWAGYVIDSFNNSSNDYAYYASQGITDYNEYSQIAYIHRAGVTITNLFDAGGVAQTYNTAKFKPSMVMTAPHHALNGNGSVQVANIIRPRYIFASDAYAATSVGYRDPIIIEAIRNGAVLISNRENYPDAIVGNMDSFQTLGGAAFTAQTNYDTRNKIWINENIDTDSYQDGSETYPYKSWRMASAMSKDVTEVTLLSDISDFTIIGAQGYIYLRGNGHSITNAIVVSRGAHLQAENVTFNGFRTSHGSMIIMESNTSNIGATYIWESFFAANPSFAHSQPINYRNSFVSIGGVVHTGTGSIA